MLYEVITPVMKHIGSPEISPAGNIPASQNFFQGAGFTDTVIPLALFPCPLSHTEDDPAFPVFIQIYRVFKPRQIGQRKIEIEVIVHVIAQQITGTVDTAQADNRVELV